MATDVSKSSKTLPRPRVYRMDFPVFEMEKRGETSALLPCDGFPMVMFIETGATRGFILRRSFDCIVEVRD